MTTAIPGMSLSVADALRRVWPRHTAKSAADAARRSHRTAEDWLQGRARGDWDALIKLMAANERMEREVLALVAAERGKATDADHGGAGAGMGAAGAGAGIGRVAGGAPVPGAAPAGVPHGPGDAAGEAPDGAGPTRGTGAGESVMAAPGEVAGAGACITRSAPIKAEAKEQRQP